MGDLKRTTPVNEVQTKLMVGEIAKRSSSPLFLHPECSLLCTQDSVLSQLNLVHIVFIIFYIISDLIFVLLYYSLSLRCSLVL